MEHPFIKRSCSIDPLPNVQKNQVKHSVFPCESLPTNVLPSNYHVHGIL